MAQAKLTTDHDEIRKWAEARGGRPAAVRSTYSKDITGIIRIEFPERQTPRMKTWSRSRGTNSSKKFDQANLALVYEEETASGEPSYFNKIIGRETAEAREHGGAPRQPPSRQAVSRTVPLVIASYPGLSA